MMDVYSIAKLARLEVKEQDIKKIEKQMQDILLMVELFGRRKPNDTKRRWN